MATMEALLEPRRKESVALCKALGLDPATIFEDGFHVSRNWGPEGGYVLECRRILPPQPGDEYPRWESVTLPVPQDFPLHHFRPLR